LTEDFVERVSQIITRYSMLAPGDRVGVAVSGGADSVVLLYILHELVSALALRLSVLHVKHRLRGEESDEHERFVANLAHELGLPLFSITAIPGPGNLEQEARDLRRAFFQLCREQHNIQKIALGHTRSDQAETVLYRFLRGSGLAGLAGMRPVTEEGLIRPLLDVTRAETRNWAKQRHIEWREDSSNANEGFARNRLRNFVMPQLAREFNPNLEGVLAGVSSVAADEEHYWFNQISSLYAKVARRCELGVLIPVGAIMAEHTAVQRRLIRRAICDVRGDLRSVDHDHVDAVLAICRTEFGHNRVIIPGVDALRSYEFLLLAKPGELSMAPRNYSIDITWNQKVILPFGAGEIELCALNSNDKNCVNFKEESQFPKEFAHFDLELLSSSAIRLQARNWRPGDAILRPGHQRPEKIKSLFQECQVLLWERRHWPVAVANDDIFWARKFGAASSYIAKSEERGVARLIYSRGSDSRQL
jgi:tRNA(Ile)-lysidine synthase